MPALMEGSAVHRVRKILALLLVVAILIAGLSLGLFNSDPVTFDYLAGRIEMPLIALMVLSGAVTALACGVISAIPLVRQRRRIARLQKELENLRQRESVATKLPASPQS